MDPIGQVYLGGIQFSTSPKVYRPFEWPKDVSDPMYGINGSVTIQDFGTFKTRNRVRLESGDQFLTQACAEALDVLKRSQGLTYTLTDWLDNEYEVYVLDFTAEPANLPDLDGTGARIGALMRYTMDLAVLDIVQLRGAPYGGD